VFACEFWCVLRCGGRVHVLIGTDGSQLSVLAAQRGVALLGKPDRVTLVTVLTEVPGDDAGGIEGSVLSGEEQEQEWKAQVAEANAELVDTAEVLTGVQIDQRIDVGDVADTICRVAAELVVDAIVVGSHARGGLGRLFLGSVSEHVVRHAPCPVLVVREQSADD
jgi:nucleotide-binding universal stress UspA family protein